MAPALLGFTFASPLEKPKPKVKNVNDLSRVAGEGEEIEELRMKNKRLLQQLEESRRKEAELRGEVEETRIRLHRAREAEERLCTQLGELEAESVEQARAYRQEIISLTERLKQVEHLLLSAAKNEGIQRRR